MRKKSPSSIDGFIPRRTGAQLGDLHDPATMKSARTRDRALHSGDGSFDAVGVAREGREITGDEVTQSLRQIEGLDDIPLEQSAPVDRAAKKAKFKKRFRRTMIALLLAGLLTGASVAGYIVYRGMNASDSVFEGNLFDVVTKSDPLEEDKNGRSNFLIFGTAEDDEGGTHGGANLTDSIMVVSVDQEKKNAYMISLPRDLWVQYEEICTVGNQGKLNAAYFCASNDGEDEQAGAEALSRQVTAITGLDIHYYVHLNFTAVVEAVDAIGGVEVTIQSSDPRGILDRNFDWKCNYTCYYVNYQNGQTVQLDGEHALALARARNAAGGYGLPNGNFDREKNQQMILVALREKALSAGTLTNVGKVTGLIDALGNNLRTNIETREIRTLMTLASEIQEANITSLSLVEEDMMLVTTGNYNGQSIVRPVAGLLDYSEIQDYIATNVSSEAYVKEKAHVSVLNASETAGVAQLQADALADLGFTVDKVDNAPEGTYDAVQIYQIGTDVPASAAKLAELYGVTLRTDTPPVSVVGETDFLIIISDATAGI